MQVDAVNEGIRKRIAYGEVLQAAVCKIKQVFALRIKIVVAACDFRHSASSSVSRIRVGVFGVRVVRRPVIQLVPVQDLCSAVHRDDHVTKSPEVAFAYTLQEHIQVEMFPFAAELKGIQVLGL